MANNFFTQTMKEHVDNDESTQKDITIALRDYKTLDLGFDEMVGRLAMFLEDVFDEQCTCNDEYSLLSDMIDCARCEVNFTEIAADYVEEFMQEVNSNE